MSALSKIRKTNIYNLFKKKEYIQAESAARDFIKFYPEDSFGWKFAGVSCLYQEKYLDAQELLLRAIERNPRDPELFSSLGVALHRQGRVKEALDCFERSLQEDPNHSPGLNGKGLCLIELNQDKEAEKCFMKALDISTDIPEVYFNLAILKSRQGQLNDAVDLARKALDLNPLSWQAHNNLGIALQDLGLIDEAIASYETAANLNPGSPMCFSNLLFVLNYHPDKTGEEIYSYYQDFDKRFGLPARGNVQPHMNDPDPARRLRIGYVSADFGYHSIRSFLLPFLEHHNRDAFEIIAYAERHSPDGLTRQYQRLFDHWVKTTSLSDDELADRIRSDQIDILVDLAGHTAGNRLGAFARRPAPVSLSWMGYGYTTGLSSIDYFFADDAMVPPESEHLFSEKIWRLDSPAFTYRPDPGMGHVSTLPALDRGAVTFGTLTRGIRINHRTIRVWSEILKQVAGSYLLVDSKSFAAKKAQENLAQRFAEHGIERERLIIGFHSPPWDILRSIDIGLDSFPHNSGTTLIESLYMGVPFITLAERPSVGRHGSMILVGAGHPEWIAGTEAEYINKAVTLATDLDRLSAIRSALRVELENSPIRDEIGFTRRVEEAYRTMWRHWCENRSTKGA